MSSRKGQLVAAAAGGALLIAALLVVLLRPEADARRTAPATPDVVVQPVAAAGAATITDCDGPDSDAFKRIRSPYRVTALDAETAAELLNRAPAAARKAYRMRAVLRGGKVAAIVIDVALGTNADARAGFLDGAQRAARRAGDRLEPAVLNGQRTLVGGTDGDIAFYGLTDCGAVIMNTGDAATARTLHGMIAVA
jgi:hypothetical protein